MRNYSDEQSGNPKFGKNCQGKTKKELQKKKKKH